MIAKQVKGKDFYGVLMYNQKKVDKGEAIILETNLSSGSVVNQTKEFNIVRQQKPNLSKAVYHTSLNLPYQDSNILSDENFSNLARDYLEGMGFDGNQHIIYKHLDQDHSHIHIVANRVKFSGDVVSDSQDYKRSETLVRKLEQKYNLTELVEKKLSNVLTKGEIEECLRTGDVPERLQLQNIIAEIIIQKVTLEELLERLKKQKVKTKLNQSATGTISGISFEFKNTTYKGSKVHRSLSWNNITKKLINNEQKRVHNAISTNFIENRKIREKSNTSSRTNISIQQNNPRKPEINLAKIEGTEINNKPKFRFRR
jgi:hypothetical protein